MRRPKSYTANKARFTEVLRPPVLHYQLDASDTDWLSRINQKRKLNGCKPIPHSVFVSIIEELEVTTYKVIIGKT